MVVQHNIPAMNANRLFAINNSGLSKSLEKLSSGYAINRAGDNAAGLAVSEKMRSQIAGLTQGVKNAQDGISMIQTYEGALTETDAILQRMKTLANQAANGTYQDEVDRDAIQLEFDQLNDELDQIADTDFNGVVMLNGGQMADGTKAVDGKFDYANKIRDPKQLDTRDVTVTDDQIFDTLDDTNGKTQADNVWNALNSSWKRNDPTKSDGPDSVDVTLKYDSESKTWSVEDATNGADKGAITVTSTTNGGFSLSAGTVNDFANVVVDQSKLVNGDTITLTLNNPKAGVSAPTNGGSSVISSSLSEGTAAGAIKEQDADLTVELANVTDAAMTEAIANAFDAMDGATLEVSYTTAATATGDLKLHLNDDDGITNLTSTTSTATVKVNGKKTDIFADFSTAGEVAIYAGTDNTGTKLMTLTATSQTADAKNTTGKITYKVNIENNAYDSTTKPSVEVKNPANNAVSKADSNSAAVAPLTYTDNLTLQSGARTKDSVNFSFKYQSNGIGNLKANMDCSSREGGLNTKSLKLTNQASANAAIDKIDNAINKVSMVRATFGATQNRLEHKIDNMNVTKENITSAESRIRDTNMAEEMTNFTKNQILSQASQAMLAQANQLPQGVLQLLG